MSKFHRYLDNGVWSILVLWVLLLAMLSASEAIARKASDGLRMDQATVVLTTEEQAWLEAHPEITLGTDRSWRPYVLADGKGSPSGIEPDLIARINALTGANIKLVTGVWSQMVAQAKAREIDGLAVSAYHEERESHFLFTDSPYRISKYIFTRSLEIRSMEGLAGKRIGLRRGNRLEEKLLKEIPEATLVQADRVEELLSLLQSGQLDAVIGGITFWVSAREKMLADIKIAFIVPDSETQIRYSIRKDWPELRSIINKALAAIPLGERLKILDKWGASGARRDALAIFRDSLSSEKKAWFDANPKLGQMALDIRSRVQLSEPEREWLESKPSIKVRVAHYPPFQFTANDKPQGLAVNYFQLLSLAFDLESQYVLGMNITESIESMQEPGGIAIQLSWQRTAEREKVALFTQPHLTSTLVIFQRQEDEPIYTMDDLVGKSVVVEKNYVIQKLLNRNYPHLQQIEVNSSMEAMKLLAAGGADVYIGSLMVSNYIRLNLGLSSIVVAAQTPFADNHMSIAVRKDLPELTAIIDKGIASMRPSEHAALKEKWTFGIDESLQKMKKQIQLSSRERAWLDAHPVIHLGGGIFPPLDGLNAAGEVEGMGRSYSDLIARKLGIRFEHSAGVWAEVHEQAKQRQIDGIRMLVPNKERDAYINFTRPYAEMSFGLVTRQSVQPIQNLSELAGKRLAALKASYDHNRVAEQHPDIELISVQSYEAGIDAVFNGEADAFIGALATVGHIIRSKTIPGLRVTSLIHGFQSQQLVIGIREEWPEFIPILDKAIASITPREHTAITREWLTDATDKGDMVSIRDRLSNAEKRWIETRPTVVARVSNFPPFHFMDQGKPAGFSIDLMNRIAHLTGFDIQYVWDISWPEGLEHVRRQDGEVDLLLTAMNTAERREFMAFSKDYLELPFKIFTRTNDDSIKKIDDLIGKIVAIEKGYAVVKIIRQAYPGIHLMEVDGHASEALRAVSSGDADAYIGNQPVANYHIINLGLVNLKVTGNTPFDFHTNAFGVRKGWPELVSILNTAMAAIPFQERLALQEKWGLSEQEAAGGSEEEKVILTDKEIAWLKAYPEIATLAFRIRELVPLSTEEREWLSAKHRVPIRVGDYPPFHFFADGLPQGISVNYMQVICMAYDLNCDYTKMSNTESTASMQEVGGIAVQTGWHRNAEREKVAIFTPPYSTSPYVIFQREGGKPILGMEDLVDKRVVVERNYAIHKLLKRDYPELNLLEVDFSTTALEKLAAGEADAYVSSIMTGHYLSLELGLPNIVIAAPAPFEPNRLAIAVRKDWPQLASIIDKSIAAITLEEHKSIRDRWLSVGYVQKIDYALAWKTALGFLILLAAVLAWNQSIRRQKMALAESETRLRKARDNADSANKAKSVFLANMSHELRTPLNAILGFSQILLRDGALDSEQEKNLGFINNGGKHLLVLINDILDLSKIESGKIELHPQPFDFHTFIETIDSIMREQAAGKDLSFVCPKKPDLPDVIEADEFRLRQVLFNLLNNAIKFTDSGEVRFEVLVTDKQDPANQTLHFEVIDMGIGIAKEDLELVFQPFERAGDFYKREEGSGLGLAISSKLVAAMGGELKVESELGKGSRFWFEVTFPVHKEASEETVSKGNVSGYKGKRLTALIADDKPGNLILLQNMLNAIGFEVVTATDGRQEVELAIKVKPDIILTDLKMPVMDGNSAARAIRKVKELADTPIIAVSAGVMEMQKNESIQAGCTDFLAKPFQLPELLNILTTSLGLEWSYEREKEETSQPAEFVLPPLDAIEKLMQAANLGNITALKREILQVRDKGSKYHPFVDKLEKWSSQYQLDKVVEFLKPYSEK